MQPRTQTQVNLVEGVAHDLCYPNNTITTLEIKNELRQIHSNHPWYQQLVSEIMADLAIQGKFDYIDNGIYRVYSLVGRIPSQVNYKTLKPKRVKIIPSLVTTDVNKVKLPITTSSGKFITITDNKGINYNGHYLGNFNLNINDYAINIKQAKTGKNFTISSNSISKVKVNNIIYQIQ